MSHDVGDTHPGKAPALSSGVGEARERQNPASTRDEKAELHAAKKSRTEDDRGTSSSMVDLTMDDDAEEQVEAVPADTAADASKEDWSVYKVDLQTHSKWWRLESGIVEMRYLKPPISGQWRGH